MKNLVVIIALPLVLTSFTTCLVLSNTPLFSNKPQRYSSASGATHMEYSATTEGHLPAPPAHKYSRSASSISWQGNTVYATISLDFKDSLAPREKQAKVNDSVDVTKMIKTTIDKTSGEQNHVLEEGTIKLSTDLFQLGDMVLYKTQFYGRIISIEPNDMVTLSYTKEDSLYTKRVSITKIYTLNRSYRDYRIGEEYYFISDNVGKGERKKVGVVVAVGLKALVTKNRFGRLEIYPYVN